MQKYLFIPLDIFKEKQQNKDKKIESKLEAWLTFLSEDDPEKVLHLIEEYPEFKAMYEDAYSLCLNIEEVMQMFSKELAEFDRNTVQLMIDEMQEELENKNKELEKLKQERTKTYEMIARIYHAVDDTKKAADMLGISVEEVKKAIEA